MAQDPLEDASDPRTLNPYQYAFNNPVEFTDPSGLFVYNPNGLDAQTRKAIGTGKLPIWNFYNGPNQTGGVKYRVRLATELGNGYALNRLGNFLTNADKPYVLLEEGDSREKVLTMLQEQGVTVDPANVYEGRIEKFEPLMEPQDDFTIDGGAAVAVDPSNDDSVGSTVGSFTEGALEGFRDRALETGTGFYNTVTTLEGLKGFLKGVASNTGPGQLYGLPGRIRQYAPAGFEIYDNPGQVASYTWATIDQAGLAGTFDALGRGLGQVGFDIVTDELTGRARPGGFAPPETVFNGSVPGSSSGGLPPRGGGPGGGGPGGGGPGGGGPGGGGPGGRGPGGGGPGGGPPRDPGSYIDSLPKFGTETKKTYGILVLEDGTEIGLWSRDYRKTFVNDVVGGPGFNANPKNGGLPSAFDHVEIQASAYLRANNIKSGTLYINNPTICPGPLGCSSLLDYTLSPGTKLDVFTPSLVRQPFQGSPVELIPYCK